LWSSTFIIPNHQHSKIQRWSKIQWSKENIFAMFIWSIFGMAHLTAEEVWRGEGVPWLGRAAARRRRAVVEGLGEVGKTMTANSDARGPRGE